MPSEKKGGLSVRKSGLRYLSSSTLFIVGGGPSNTKLKKKIMVGLLVVP